MDQPRPGQALAATLEEPGFYAGDPFRTTRAFDREAPLAWNAELGYWAVSKHADVVAISRDPRAFCSGKGILTFEIGVEYPSPPTMMHTDPPDHTRYRKLVQPGFAPSRIAARRHACGPAPTSWSHASSPAGRSTRSRSSRCRSRSGSSPSCSASRSRTGSASTCGRKRRYPAPTTGRPKSARVCKRR